MYNCTQVVWRKLIEKGKYIYAKYILPDCFVRCYALAYNRIESHLESYLFVCYLLFFGSLTKHFSTHWYNPRKPMFTAKRTTQCSENDQEEALLLWWFKLVLTATIDSRLKNQAENAPGIISSVQAQYQESDSSLPRYGVRIVNVCAGYETTMWG